MNAYEVRVCEDTGKQALYRRTEHGGGPALILIAHEGDFFTILKALADVAVSRSGSGPG